MKSPRSIFAVQKRAGIALILAVGLLVLLAIIAVAFVAGSSSDRTASQQHVANTQVDTLADGVMQMAITAVRNNLYDVTVSPHLLRPAGDSANFHLYSCADSNNPLDAWLADRLPEYNPATSGALWQAISAPLGGGAVFVDPSDPANATKQYTQRRTMYPTALTVNGTVYPAFTGPGAAGAVVAADADGDGIADAGLFPLNVGRIGGWNWYAAVRIIDNNSAININTAWDRNPANMPVGGDWLSNTGLAELLDQTTATNEMLSLNTFRAGGGTFPATPVDDPLPTNTYTPTTRPDFTFLNDHDALHAQLARRVASPGYATVTTRSKAFALADQAALARHFCIVNPLATPSQIETALNTSAYGLSPNGSYAPGNATSWFNSNFNFDSVTTAMPVRALLVARNPLSNQIVQHSPLPIADMPVYLSTGKGAWNSNTVYQPGDIVTSLGVGGGSATFIATAGDRNGQNWGYLPSVNIGRYWDNATLTTNPMKASLNTAGFPELWRAYWNVMCDDVNPTQIPSYLNTPALSGGMFRNSLRDTSNSGFGLTTSTELLLRSMLAATNAVNWRSPGRDVIGRRCTNFTSPSMEVTAYGYQPQPFITEVYASNDTSPNAATGKQNHKGYVAVELYNPYPFAIDISNWQLTVTNRSVSVGGYPYLTLTGITTSQGIGNGNTVVVPAGKYLVLDNLNPAGGDPVNANYRPNSAGTIPAGVSVVSVPNLHTVMQDASAISCPGGELTLLRPRRADNALLSTPDADNCNVRDWNEQNDYDLVPVDQFDFTGLSVPQKTSGNTFTVLHYVRANDANHAWQFVYPGRYTASAAAFRQAGTITATWTQGRPGAMDPWDPSNPHYTAPMPPITLGQPAAAASYSPTFTIPLLCTNKAGPNVPGQSGNAFPFGGFARLGDLLQVPFIGAYRVRQLANVYTLANAPGVMVEMNSITMDAAFADDNDPTDDAVEQVGRFYPLAGDINPSTPTAALRYAWATRLFDYFAIFAPHDDYLPAAPNTLADAMVASGSQAAFAAANVYPGAAPTPVFTADPAAATPTQAGEDGVDGLININTAPAAVLAMLPMVNDSTQPRPANQNYLLAKAIVNYREQNGPFQSVFALNNIPDFQSAMNGTAYDTLTRISNLITTHSDTFTVYVDVQGWSGTSPPTAKRMVEKRRALIVDRGGIGPASVTPLPITTAVPAD